MLTVVARALKTPHCHACCEEKSSSHASAPCGVAIATSTLRSCCTPRCSRNLLEAKFRANAPNGVAVATSVYLCPRRSLPTSCRRDAPTRRHMHRTNAWRRLVPGQPDCVGVPRCRASLDLFESSRGSPQALSAAIIRCHAVGVTRQNAGHFQRRRLVPP